jgi:hypothetical protein
VPFALQDQARKAASSTASRPLRIIHAGAFYPGMRGPEPLIAALKLLSQRRQLKNALEIDCIGVDTSYYQQKVDHAGVSDVLRLHTAVSFDECQKRITESDVILIIDTPGFGGVFLPTKLIEAFAFKKVVLGIAETDSATASVLRDVEQPLADIHDPQSIAAELESILNRWQSGNLAPDATQCAKFEQFQIDQVNQKLSNVLNSIIHKKYG